MTITLNHTIVWCTDQDRSANFLADLFDLPAPVHWGPFVMVDMANGVSLDYLVAEGDGTVAPQHYAFLVSEDEFDAIFGRIVEQGIDHWADPGRRHARTVNHEDGGRGVYFEDPDGHLLEIITRPYGSGDPAQ